MLLHNTLGHTVDQDAIMAHLLFAPQLRIDGGPFITTDPGPNQFSTSGVAWRPVECVLKWREGDQYDQIIFEPHALDCAYQRQGIWYIQDHQGQLVTLHFEFTQI